MVKIAKLLFLAACLMALLTVCVCAADVIDSGSCGTNLTYTLDSDGVLTISGTGDMTDWSSYSSVPWYSNRESVKSVVINSGVTSIGDYAFYYCSSLTSVTIPDSVTSIGEDAFNECYRLTSITIPDSVTSIGGYAFSSCTRLTSVIIGNSVTSIGDYAFTYCTSLSSITIPDSVTSIGDYAFSSCESLTSITIPKGVTSIGDAAFFSCESLTSITIPNSVTSIGDYAFSYCTSLTSITIPEGVTSIGEYAFYGCSSLTSITIPDSVTSIADYAFCRCIRLANVTIGIESKLVNIGFETFSSCSSLVSITIPVNVTSIDWYAFYNCRSLENITIDTNNKFYSSDSGILYDKNRTTVICCPAGTKMSSFTIPSGVTSVVGYAFYNCSNITNITIPASVTSIGTRALGYYYDNINNEYKLIDSFTIYGKAGSIAETYANENGITFVELNSTENVASGECGDNLIWTLDSEGTLTISGTGFMADDWIYSSKVPWYSNRDSIKEVVIDSGVTSIGYRAFSYCTSLTNITIPDSVTNINSNAFSYCTSLTSINIPSSVTSIGSYAFNGCTSLTSINIPSSVTSIGSYAFNGCTSLTSFTIPDNVTSIGIAVFEDCTSLMSITIPDSVTSIGNLVFYHCRSLTSITIPDSVTSIGSYAFFGCSSLESITIPDSVTNIGEDAFFNCTSLEEISVNDNNQFYCDNKGILYNKEVTTLICSPAGTTLIHYDIPSSVTSISKDAFVNCTSLTSITIPDGVANIGDDAFYKCTSLTSIIIPDSVTNIGEAVFTGCSSLTIYGTKGSYAEIYANNNGITFISLADLIKGGTCGTNLTWSYNTLTEILTISGTGAMSNYSSSYPAPWNEYVSNIKTVVINDGVTSIGNQAFMSCTVLTDITLPDTLSSIGSYAFYKCTALGDVIMPAGVTSIGTYAFRNCINATLHVLTGSTAHTYAKNNSISFVELPLISSSGVSLVLDGSIGVKTYFELYEGVSATVKCVINNTLTSASAESVITPEYDEEKGLYYVVTYVAPKDIDNTEITLTVIGGDTSEELSTVTVSDYIEKFKELATEDETYANALGLVESLETYTKYADSYFGAVEVLDSVTADTEAINEIASPTKSGTLAGIEHMYTSLILEGKTTIRHYFKVTNSDTEYVFELGGKTLEAIDLGEGIYCVDIADIAANDLDEVYTLTVNDTLNISYSALNYIKQTVNSDDTAIANLVKALYNYWYQAEQYVK